MSVILIAEDDLALQSALRDTIRKKGYEVIVANNGQEALDAVSVQKPDLILLDIMMPVKDGLETLEQLKSDPETRAIPVLILTNYGYGFLRENAQYGGAVDYLIKSDDSLHVILDKIYAILPPPTV